MRYTITLAALLLSLTVIAVAQNQTLKFEVASVKASQTAPIAIGWQQGHCSNCQTARDNITVLESIRFISRREAWARAASFPVHEGVPDYTVLHTSDSGRTWSEVTRAVQVSRGPALSFSDATNGWISSWNFMAGPSLSREELIRRREPELVQTKDGGQHWQKLSDRLFDWIHVFAGGFGYGTENSHLLKTIDGGQTWTPVNFPEFSSVTRALFLSPQIGWIAGWINNKNFVLYRTVDGGTMWEPWQGMPITNITDLWFYDSDHGWFITRARFDNDPYLFKTVDGGKTWRPESNSLFRGIHHMGTVVRFVSRNTGFVFEDEITYTRDEPRAPSNTMRYTTDAGAHWNDQAIHYAVQDCQVSEGDLLCAASPRDASGFGVLTVHLAK